MLPIAGMAPYTWSRSLLVIMYSYAWKASWGWLVNFMMPKVSACSSAVGLPWYDGTTAMSQFLTLPPLLTGSIVPVYHMWVYAIARLPVLNTLPWPNRSLRSEERRVGK